LLATVPLFLRGKKITKDEIPDRSGFVFNYAATGVRDDKKEFQLKPSLTEGEQYKLALKYFTKHRELL